MASNDGKNLETDDSLDSPRSDPSSSPTMHSVSYTAMPMHMFPFSPGIVPAQSLRNKRRQVKNACTNCQKACKKCDDARPCLRCTKYGVVEACVDSQRRERKKGIKRGPYKKRDGKGNNESFEVPEQLQQQQQGVHTSNGHAVQHPPPTSPPPIGPYMGSVGFAPPGFYQYPPGLPAPKPGEAPPQFYQQVYLAPMPQHPQHPPNLNNGAEAGQEHPGAGVYAQQAPPQYYPTFLNPYAQPFTPYVMHARADGQMQIAPAPHAHYPPFNPAMYPLKPPSVVGGSGDAREEERPTGGSR